MIRKRALNAALVTGAALCLNACVAAAIPLVAGGALARASTDGKDADTPKPDTAPTNTQTAPSPEKATAARAELLRLSQGPTQGNTQNLASVSSQAAALPNAPPAETPRAFDNFVPNAASPSSDFVQYAMSPRLAGSASSFGRDIRPLSAVLADPSSLDGRRKSCEASQRSVLIDVDGAGGQFSPGMTFGEDPALAQGLAALRADDISVVWISQAPAAYAGDLQAALQEGGLDPAGRDQIVLMRYPGERKQTRREEVAASSCLIAIAGDERADFDELFQYLAHPEAALGLELLIGDGWFLVPSLVKTNTQDTDLLAKDTNTP